LSADMNPRPNFPLVPSIGWNPRRAECQISISRPIGHCLIRVLLLDWTASRVLQRRLDWLTPHALRRRLDWLNPHALRRWLNWLTPCTLQRWLSTCVTS
jgi:hypothetical protein